MFVYMDHTATTPTSPEVINAMLPYFGENFGNPSSVYSFSRITRKAIEKARNQVAVALNADDGEIFFTASGTEADNWALKGTLEKAMQKGKNHLITTSIEHHAILHTAEYLHKYHGVDVTYLPVDSEGRVSVDDVKNSITDKTALVSIMFANHEVGTIEPISEIGALCREMKIPFHTDAVQAAAHLNIDVKAMNIDMLSMSAHKMYGPKGVGALFMRKGLVKPENFIHGGAQEKGRRASTENIAGIVGFGEAMEILKTRINEDKLINSARRDKLISGILERIPHAKLNGATGENRLPNNINFSFIGVEGETLLLDLDAKGISASTGSACSSESLDPSHVLLALGLKHEMAHGSLRFTIGRLTTDEHIDYLLEVLPEIVAKRRAMSPLWEDYLKGVK